MESPKTLESKIRSLLLEMCESGELVGAQYGAVRAGERLADVQVGLADAATNRPMEKTTYQMAYSITKAITAIATLQLQDAGRLSLDMPLSSYVAGHPYGDAVSIRHLLGHTAGVPGPAPLSWFVVEGEPLDRGEKLREQLRLHPRLRAAPGRSYHYTNLGYWLLEEVITACSGKDYATYVQEQIFRPLGVDSYMAFAPPEKSQMAVGHSARYRPLGLLLRALTPARYWSRPAGRWRRAARVLPYGLGYGGLFCSAEALVPVVADLVRPEPTLLSPAAKREMFAPQVDTSGRLTGSALGWVCGTLHSTSYFGKQGGGLGFHGNLRVYPDLGLATVFVANVTEISAGPIDRRSDKLDGVLVSATQRRP